MSTPKRLLETILISVAFLLVLILVLFVTEKLNLSKLEPIHVFVALVPFIILLVMSGRLKEIGGPSGITLSLRDEVQKPISPETARDELIVDPEITMEKGAIPDIQEQVAQNPPTTLSLRIRQSGRYSELAIRHYVEELERQPVFRNVLFVDAQSRFQGLMPAQAFRALLQGREVVPLLENGEILELPGVVTGFVPVGSTNQQALVEMDRIDTNTLAVVNQREEFVGVITQEEIVRKVLTKVMREA
jgi:hypothetical protein